MKDDHLVDLPDDEYRAHWLAFHEQLDWSARQDVTLVPITYTGPDALYRTNKGSFMERLQPEVHCRPYAAHARRARRTGAWIPEEKLFEASLVPALDLTRESRRGTPKTHCLSGRMIGATSPPPSPQSAAPSAARRALHPHRTCASPPT